MTWKRLAVLCATSLPAAIFAARLLAADPPAAGSPPPLAGTTWHTVHIAGDALFILVDELGIRFESDGRFAARVRLVDGQSKVRTGTYRVEGDTILVDISGAGAPKQLQYWADGSAIVVRDKAYAVTARLEPGQMEESWF